MTKDGVSRPVEAHPWRDKILARCAAWNWHSPTLINILDSEERVMSTLDSWQTYVFHEADGNHTTEQLLSAARAQFPAQEGIDDLILNAVDELVESLKAVELWDHADDLPYDIEFPRSKMSKEEALRLMRADGLIP